MKKLLTPLMLVWLLGLTECGDTGIYGTFVPADGSGFGVTIQIAGGTAYLRSMGMEQIVKCEIVDMKYVESGRPFKAIRFRFPNDQAFYAEILEVDPDNGKVQTIKVDWLWVGGIYKRTNES